MQPLNPGGGTTARFAGELRALRAIAGEPPFWKMARRCAVSKSALAAAVDGHSLPSENVLREFVAVCRGDWDWWRDRLRRARDELLSETRPAPELLPHSHESLSVRRSTALVPRRLFLPVAPRRSPAALMQARNGDLTSPSAFHGFQPRSAAGTKRRWALTAAAAVAAAAVGARLMTDSRSTDAVRQNQGPTAEQNTLARSGQITDRFNAAVTNLGSGNKTIRLGGIYALQQIMDDSPADQPAVAQVLASYIRTTAPAPALSAARSTTAGPPPIDLQTALTVFAERDPLRDGTANPRYDLHGTDLEDVDLTSGDLAGADLRGADLADAGLVGADLDAADLDTANLTSADLANSELRNAVLVGTDLIDANLTDADLSGVSFGGSVNLTGADLTDANLTGVNEYGSRFLGAVLTGPPSSSSVNFTNANLTDASLTDVSLEGANLRGANLEGVNLTGADLDEANLTGADLSGTSLCHGSTPIDPSRGYRCRARA